MRAMALPPRCEFCLGRGNVGDFSPENCRTTTSLLKVCPVCNGSGAALTEEQTWTKFYGVT